ncbi:MAG: polyribonucleotide nucleotidyltransferase [candidate division Zixibacteria bacterium]|nr:polyribonucleotide nucleotidyltransferase [candidate division Zixibacteria bacterium]
MVEQIETIINDKPMSIETGRVARQANGAVWIRYGDTVVMAAVVSDEPRDETQDFLPLTVDYREKAYAAGKIPGGFFKREGRPSEKEILSARLIDRPIRPLFPDKFNHEIQVFITVLSADQENDGDVLGINAASAALALSDIPFTATIGAVRVGRINGELVANPTFTQLEETDMNMVVVGTKDHINMVEGGTREVSEGELVEGLKFAHSEINKIIDSIEQLTAKVGKAKVEFIPPALPEGLEEEVTQLTKDKVLQANQLQEKQAHYEAIKKIKDDAIEALAEKYPENEHHIEAIIKEIEKEDMRRIIIQEERRMDGRGMDDVRPITCEIGVLPRTHGSSIFTRGQTQALVAATLGTKMDEQKIDDLEGETFKSFMLHYNFPSYSVGEARPIRGPGRREIGHGALAERAIEPIVPSDTGFPYTIRLVSDILESNGSSSMATVCGGTLALMDAGVPIKLPVAGIAMGLVKESDIYKVLTDILGVEDHLGDMDFKVTGTREGITAFQMDVKISGIGFDIITEALGKAQKARFHVLDEMEKAISKPRTELSPYAPRIIFMKINKEKIGDVIGPGGKNIRRIIEESGAKVDIEDDGMVLIASVDQRAGELAQRMVEEIVEEPEVGKVYDGVVRGITSFGAFVEILPGTDGLVHISELENRRVGKVEDVCKVGDKMTVKVIGIDPSGKIKLSKKQVSTEEVKR